MMVTLGAVGKAKSAERRWNFEVSWKVQQVVCMSRHNNFLTANKGTLLPVN